ncbi:MAG TPA: anti-sigma factor [Planococcus sp. (in: firmicutes)]|nr:anti-sigma factor [Planococcus sp. (in: firmicutes)]
MNNEHCEGLVDYLNGTLSAEETRQFEEHLKTCDECREIADATGQLPYLSDPAELPAGMKSRILSNVFAEDSATDSSSASSASAASSAAGGKASSSSHAESAATDRKPHEETGSNVVPMTDRGRKRGWGTPLIAAVLIASLVGNAYTFMQLQQERAEPTPAPTEPTTAFQSIELQPSEDFTGGGTAAVIEEEGGALNLVVTAEQLAALEGEQVYQVWLIEGDNPIPAGAFTTNADGEGATYFNIDNNTEEWDTIAITLEPQPGNEMPQGQVVLSAGL